MLKLMRIYQSNLLSVRESPFYEKMHAKRYPVEIVFAKRASI